MAKYGQDIIIKICDLIIEDDYTIPEICLQVGITISTYHEWKASKPDFSDALKKAHEKRLEVFKQAARSGLMTLLKGKDFDEVTKEYVVVKGKKTLVGEKTVKKHIMPNPTAVIFALKNTDPDNFRDVIQQEVTADLHITWKEEKSQ